MKSDQVICAAIPFLGLSRLCLPHPPSKHPYSSPAGERTSLFTSRLGLLLFFPFQTTGSFFTHRPVIEAVLKYSHPFSQSFSTPFHPVFAPWEALVASPGGLPRPPKLKCFSQAAILHPAPLPPQPQCHAAVEKYPCTY